MNDVPVHLHLHSEYTFLESTCRISQLVSECKNSGMKAMAIAEKSNIFSAFKFFEETKKQGIKPLMACQMNIKNPFNKEISSLLLYVKNNEGYKNLMQLLSYSYKNDENRPYIEYENLHEHSSGLIACIGMWGSSLFKSIEMNLNHEAMEIYRLYLSCFHQDDLYLYISKGTNFYEDSVVAKKIAFCKMSSLKPIAMNEVYYIRKEDSVYQDVLNCIGKSEKLSDEGRAKLPSDNFYFKPVGEMQSAYDFCPEALSNTIAISEVCEFNFQLGEYHMPKFPLPKGKSSSDVLIDDTLWGLRGRYDLNLLNEEMKNFKNFIFEDLSQVDKMAIETKLKSISYGSKLSASELAKRIKRTLHELSVIIEMGFEDYFLICADYVRYAKEKGIQVGPGRGSGGGSLVCYLLGIIDLDPVKYDLIFERFLNPERIDMPDLDIDFQDSRRQDVIDYVIEKYGRDKVSLIISFGTLKARQVIRDVGRVLDAPKDLLDKLSRSISITQKNTLEHVLNESEEFKSIILQSVLAKKIYDYSIHLEGLVRHNTLHPAGVVVADNPVNMTIPTFLNQDKVISQYDMDDLKKLGILKMDFLGLRNLNIIADTLESIEKHEGTKIEFEIDECNDVNAFNLLSEAKTLGIFQLESEGMMNFIKRLKPKCMEDLMLGISIYRPGPAESIPKYLENRKNPEKIKYKHKLLEPILKDTNGCLVYQEQVMKIARVIGGYTYGRADLIRRAVSKKNKKIMLEERQNFIHGNVEEKICGAINNGVSEKIASEIYDEIVEFAKYAFNKSHAASYAIVAYREAYLKANYPEHFMAALISSVSSNQDKVKQYMDEAWRMGIMFLRPDIRKSGYKFHYELGCIRFGFGALKYLGNNLIYEIEKMHRDMKNIPENLSELYKIAPAHTFNKKNIEVLTLSGALDCFDINKSEIIENFEDMYRHYNPAYSRVSENQISIGDIFKDANLESDYELKRMPEYNAEYLASAFIENCLYEKKKFYSIGPNTKIFIKLHILSEEVINFLENFNDNFKNGDKNSFYEFGNEVIIYEEKYNRSRKFINKIALNEENIRRLKDKFLSFNVKIGG